MDYRRASRIAEWLLVAVVVGLHLTIFLWPETPGQPQLFLAAAHDAQLLAGVVLILAWGVLGPGKWWLRLGILPVLLLLWALPWNTRIIPREPSNNLPNLVAIAAAVAIVALRLCGFRAQRLDPAAGPERGAQFSLLGLLVVTTLIAAAIGGLEALRPILSRNRGDEIEVLLGTVWSDEANWQRYSPIMLRKIVMAIAVALSAIGGIWIVARPGAVWFRLGAVAAAIPILAGYLVQLSGDTDARTAVAVNLGIGLALVAGWTALSVLPLRMLDCRLTRKAMAPTGNKPQPADGPRLLSRAVILSGLLILLGVILAARPLLRRFEPTLHPPATAFARWISPPPPPVIWDDLRLSYTKSVRLFFTWEARKSLHQIVTEVRDIDGSNPPPDVPENKPEEQP